MTFRLSKSRFDIKSINQKTVPGISDNPMPEYGLAKGLERARPFGWEEATDQSQHCMPRWVVKENSFHVKVCRPTQCGGLDKWLLPDFVCGSFYDGSGHRAEGHEQPLSEIELVHQTADSREHPPSA
jgi:hypothetical protein